jgi:hypothetical protein
METKTIITPIGKNKVELKNWINGREYEEIQKPITDIKATFETAGLDRGLGKGEMNVGEVYRKSTENAIKIVVISIDGDAKNILDRVMSMRKEDYLFVVRKVDEVVTGKNFTPPEQKRGGGIGAED